MFIEIGVTDYKHLLIRVVNSPSLLEYDSDKDAEGEVNTDNSYVTPPTSSPVHPEVQVVETSCECGEPAEGHLDEARALVPIEEIEEVPETESDEVPEENKEPLQIHEQPLAYSPVHGQCATHGGRITLGAEGVLPSG